jgi:hypothetical protein
MASMLELKPTTGAWAWGLGWGCQEEGLEKEPGMQA